VNYCEDELGFCPKKIIMVGDSAGGNLILSITLMAIKRGFRVPDGVVPCYPATLVSVE
jgi:hormone-sensitive lipase